MTFALQLASPVFFPALKLKFFIPFLILVYYQKTLPVALWCSLACGLILDLLSPVKFGIYAAAYCLTTTILYSQKFNFFADNAMTMPIMTFGFSLLSTLIELSLLYIFGKPVVLSVQWGVSELFMLFADTFYSFFIFILPFSRSGYSRRA